MATINCPRCNTPVHGLSDEDLIYATDYDGNEHIIPKGAGRDYCHDNKINIDWTELPKDDTRRIPHGFCKSCIKEMRKHTEIVKDGGLMFQCLECNNTGVVMGSEETLNLKHKLGFKHDDLVGIEFNNCSEHEGINYDEDTEIQPKPLH